MITIKKAVVVLSLGVGVILSGGCEILDALLQKPDSDIVSPIDPQLDTPPLEQSTSDAVMESFDQGSTNWRPILPHELDAHFEESDTLLKLMRYARRLNGLNQQEFEQEYQSVQTRPAAEATEVSTRLQEALLLSASASPFRNDEQAKKLLADIVNRGDKRGVLIREFAYSVLVRIEQREKIELQNQQLRKNLKKEIERRELLEQKLEALKSIEESITQRQNKTEEPTP